MRALMESRDWDGTEPRMAAMIRAEMEPLMRTNGMAARI